METHTQPATHDVSIQTAAVEIKVVRVGGHKMTRAVWEQIQDEWEPKELASAVQEGRCLGYVHGLSGYPICLLVINGDLRKYSLSKLGMGLVTQIMAEYPQLYIAI